MKATPELLYELSVKRNKVVETVSGKMVVDHTDVDNVLALCDQWKDDEDFVQGIMNIMARQLEKEIEELNQYKMQ